MDLSFDVSTLDYAGARSLGFMSGFLQNIEWWKLEPHPELVLDNPSPFCSAVPGREYLLFLRYGGTVRLDLRQCTPQDEFQVQWVDLVEEKVHRRKSVTGGTIVELSPPEDYPGSLQYKDWLVHLLSDRYSLRNG